MTALLSRVQPDHSVRLADEAYGKDYKFRTWLETRRISFVVAVARPPDHPCHGRHVTG
ncbi:hypothetical protein [Amycolatopsis sp. cmx-11-51]|uniref:hypothetical protein n=1 Tax=Amycolatopsis sp. cmx-11-51 TaxID=2785797 RepID=UPI0039E2ABB8